MTPNSSIFYRQIWERWQQRGPTALQELCWRVGKKNAERLSTEKNITNNIWYGMPLNILTIARKCLNFSRNTGKPSCICLFSLKSCIFISRVNSITSFLLFTRLLTRYRVGLRNFFFVWLLPPPYPPYYLFLPTLPSLFISRFSLVGWLDEHCVVPFFCNLGL